MKISIIVAQAENRAIGKDNQMIWHLPKEFAHFKKTTLGHCMIMGRKNFESIGKPLPGRTSIVITRNTDYTLPEGVIKAHSLEEAIAIARKKNEMEVFIIGGGQIYEQAMTIANKLYLTTVHESFVADVFFPEMDETEWKLITTEVHQKDEKNKYTFTIKVYEKIK